MLNSFDGLSDEQTEYSMEKLMDILHYVRQRTVMTQLKTYCVVTWRSEWCYAMQGNTAQLNEISMLNRRKS